MSLGPAWAASAPLPTYARRDDNADDGAVYENINAQPPQTTDSADKCATTCCGGLPVPIRHALDFCVDVAQLTMPTLFIPELRNLDCPLEDLICRSKMSLFHSRGGNNNRNTPIAPNVSSSNTAAEKDSREPGDTFGFESSQPCSCSCKCCTDRCCFVSSAATLRSWTTLSWRGLGVSGKGMGYRLSPLCRSNTKAIPYKVIEETLVLASDSSTVDPATLPPPPTYEPRLVPLSHAALRHHNDASASISKHDDALDDATYAERLLTVNQYLLRRIRKLELTNQIVREAYSEVQEILEAERQSKATQIGALEKKHDEELNDLYTELTERNEGHRGSFSIRRRALTDSDSDSDSDYTFRPGFSTVKRSEPKKASSDHEDNDENDDGGVEFVRSKSSSSILHSRSRVMSPPRIQRSVSDLAFSTMAQHDTGAEGVYAHPPELEVEFAGPALVDNNSIHDRESEYDDHSSVCSGSGFDSDDSSNSQSSDASNDNDTENESDHEADKKQHSDLYSCVFNVGMVEFVAPHEYKDNDDEPDLVDAGYSSDSESDSEDDISDDEEEGEEAELELSDEELDLTSFPRLHLSPDDYAFIDPAKAVLERYYPKTGMLNLEADIDDLPDDGEDEDGADVQFTRKDTACTDSDTRAGEFDHITHPGSGDKSFDDMDMDLIAQLPADQRIAKFVFRASSHLLQGARGGLSLGFMLHNLEALAEKFASNHVSIICAFVESLYQIVEPLSPTSDDVQSESSEAEEDATTEQQKQSHPRSALAKKAHEGICSPQQAARRVARLLHTFITLPEDQHTVLHQLEQLSEANGKVRLLKHVLLLRIIYECELVDRSSIESWYSSMQQQQQQQQFQDDGVSKASSINVDSTPLPVVERSQLLRKNAAPLIDELSNLSRECIASSSRISLNELHHQIQQAGGAGSSTMLSQSPTSSSSSSSAASLSMPEASCGIPPAVICGHFAGVTTPVSEETSTLNSHSSECEFVGTNKSNVAAVASDTGANILNIGRRGGGGSQSLSSTAIGSEHHLVDSYLQQCAKSDALGVSSVTIKSAKQVTFATM